MSSSDFKSPTIMGIINATPDSFSGDGLADRSDFVSVAALQAEEMVAAGAGIIDIGGESTRPGMVQVSLDEEYARVMPVIAEIRRRLPDILLSIDTTKPAIAVAACEAGCTIINDVSRVTDPRMIEIARRHDAILVVMHNAARASDISSEPLIGAHYVAPASNDIVLSVADELKGRVEHCLALGLTRDRIWIDPGIGFGKTVEQNCALINHLDHLKEKVGLPILIGPSRKSFLGKLSVAAPEDRLEGTAAAALLAMMRGAATLRVHDVLFVSRMVRALSSMLAA